MKALVERAEKDDEVVFYYSGHGSQQTDGKEKDEADGKDETLVPYDGGRPPHPNRDISDDEIYLWLLELTARTPFVTLIFDCCHSGTILRDSFGGKQRSIPEDTRAASELAACLAPEACDLLRGGESSPTALRRLGDKYVALSSCGSSEAANEIRVGAERRLVHGALTYYLVEALMAPSFAGATWREIFEYVRSQMAAHCQAQHPELEGAQDREVFGLREIRPMTYVPVESREGDVVVLGAGQACGLTVGSSWDVYAAATRSLEDEMNHVGQVEVFEVGVTSSKAREVTRGAGRGDGRAKEREEVRKLVRAGMRAVESARSIPKVLLKVEVVTPPGHPSAERLSALLKCSRLLTQASCGSEADVRVYLLAPRTDCGPKDPAPMLGPLSEETWVPVAHGDLAGLRIPARYAEAEECLVENLENYARRQGLARIRNDASPLRDLVDFFVHRREGEGCAVAELDGDGTPVFFEGDRLVLEIKNRSQMRLFFYVLDVGLTGKVSPVFPPLGSHEPLERSRRVCVGLRPGEDLQLFIPEDFRYFRRFPEGMPAEGVETLKLFVTPSAADFGPLYLPPMRVPYRHQWCLNDLLDATFHGSQGFMRTQEDWTVIDKTFRLRAR
jgi:caspase domain-containing protein